MAIQLLQRLLLLAAVLTAPFSARAITTTRHYTVTIFGLVQHNYPESTFLANNSINDYGVVAGSATVRVPDNFSLATRGVLWQSSTSHGTILGTISEVPGPLMLPDSEALWVNNSGIAVGASEENTSHGFVYVPVIFTPNGIVDLGVKNAAYGVADCINNHGQVVGNLSFLASPGQATEAFLYQNGVMTPLGYPVPNSGYSFAAAINDSGLIVGSAIFALGKYAHAACYANGAWVDLGFTGAATSVNDSGTIVGTWADKPGGGNGIFIYQNGQMTHLDAPTSVAENAFPFINNAGQIVLEHLIYQNRIWRDINLDLVDDGWKFLEASGINNQGAIIGIVSKVVNGTILYLFALLTPVSPNQPAATRTP
jgi:probable HAF family extracellular repeat protein